MLERQPEGTQITARSADDTTSNTKEQKGQLAESQAITFSKGISTLKMLSF